MPSQVINIEEIHKYGFIADSPSIALPSGAFSDVLNVRFDNGAIRKVKGYVELFDTLNLTNIKKIHYWPNPNKAIWIVINREGSIGAEEDHIYAVYLDSNNVVTATDISQNTGTGYTTSEKWQVTLFNGGYSIILNPGNGTPQHSTDTQGSASIPAFADLPNWDSYVVDTTTVSKVYAGIVIAVGNVILAGDLTEYDSSNNIVRDLRGVVRSSSVAAPGTIPQNWNPFAVGAGTADELTIADTGEIKAMKPLQGKVIVYTSNSISQLNVTNIGLNEIRISDQYGGINQDSVYEYDGRHIVLGSNDIYSFSGHPSSIESISDGRVRRFYYNDVHGSSTGLTRIVRNPSYDELWVCYRSNNNTTETLDYALVWNYRHNIWSKRSLPNLVDINLGPVTGGGVDTQTYTFEVTGVTGTNTPGTQEVQEITVSGATLTGGTTDVQQATYSGTRSNVVGDQNEVYTITLNDITTSEWSPIVSGNSSVTSKSVSAVAYGTSSSSFGGIDGLTITAPSSDKSITYTSIKGDGGSPPVGTKTLTGDNQTAFSYPWHNRTFSGNQSSWQTSMVRETHEQVAYCKTQAIYTHKLGWRWTSGYNSYTQRPYYFTLKVTGKHRTTATGSFLTGTHYYTLAITRDDQTSGDAKASRYTSNPGDPTSTAVASGATAVETNIGFLYDLNDCDVEFYFNAEEPGTSSASFQFNYDSGPKNYEFTNNSLGKITVSGTTLNIGDSATINSDSSSNFSLSSQLGTSFLVDLDTTNVGTFPTPIFGVYDANTTTNTSAAEQLKDVINAAGLTGVVATRSSNVVTIDTGQQSNLSGSYTVTMGTGATGGTYTLTSQNGINNPTFASSYSVFAPDGTQVTSFTSSVSDTANSDLATVLSTIQTAIQNYTDLSTNISGSTVSTTSPNIIITNGIAKAVVGTWSITVNHNGVTGADVGDISVGSTTKTAEGVTGALVTGTLTKNATDYGTYTVFNTYPTTSTNAEMTGLLAVGLNDLVDDWTVTSNGNNLVFTDNIARETSDTFAITISSSDASTPSAGTASVTTNGIDFTIEGTVTSTMTPTIGNPVVVVTSLSGIAQNAIATAVANDLNARPEFVATANTNVVSLEYTQFGDAAPQLDIEYQPGTILSGTVASAPVSDLDFTVVSTRDLERPWPLTFINENFSYLVGITEDTFYGFDIGNEANGSYLNSYIERKNIHVSPTKDTENYTAFYLDTEGDNGEFTIRIAMTNSAGQSVSLEGGVADVEEYSLIFGGDSAQYKADTRASGRIANYRIESNEAKPWIIAGIAFEFDKGGTR